MQWAWARVMSLGCHHHRETAWVICVEKAEDWWGRWMGDCKKYMTLKYGSMLIELYFKNKNNKNVGGVERDGEREEWAHGMPFVTYWSQRTTLWSLFFPWTYVVRFVCFSCWAILSACTRACPLPNVFLQSQDPDWAWDYAVSDVTVFSLNLECFHRLLSVLWCWHFEEYNLFHEIKDLELAWHVGPTLVMPVHGKLAWEGCH